MAFKYIRKTDWGDYWVAENAMAKPRLIERSLEIAAKMGLRLFDFQSKQSIGISGLKFPEF